MIDGKVGILRCSWNDTDVNETIKVTDHQSFDLLNGHYTWFLNNKEGSKEKKNGLNEI